MSAMFERIIQVRHESAAGCWEFSRQMPAPALASYVLHYTGYVELSPQQTIIRREVPSSVVGLIINFGAPFKILDPRPDADWLYRNHFIAGLHDRPALVESHGASHCMQIDFTPLGACRFFGCSLGDINTATTPLDAVFGAAGELWVERLYHARSWRERFTIVEYFLFERFRRAKAPRPEVEWAWSELVRSQGTRKIADLARFMNRSREHCARLIQGELGMTPKRLARIIRFEQAMQRLQSGMPLVEIAHACGYTDQSHFIGECKALSGCSPTELRQRFAGDGGLIEPVP